MKELLQLLILLIALQSCNSNAQKSINTFISNGNTSVQLNEIIPDGNYLFIMRSGKNDEIRKSGDSLIFEENIMKIIQIKKNGSTTVLGLEKIRTNQ